MYEIWLAMNILWELALPFLPLIALAFVVWAALVLAARRRHGRRSALPAALAIAALVAIATFLLLPAMTRSSLADLAYWVDWANVAGIAVALGAIAAVLSWPIVTLLAPRR